MRKIIHVDMDAFYASVEQRDDPALRNRPLVVGGAPDSRGVVAACSYEARAYGIRSAMPCSQAWRLCPETVFVPPRFEVYRGISQQIRQVFAAFTDLIEPLSLDEAYLDVSACPQLDGSAVLIAREIKKRILGETGLTASAGVSYNKFLAKVASAMNKPDGLTVILPGEGEAFVETLPIGKFYGIGPVTEKKMLALGIKNGADLKQRSFAELQKYFGRSAAYFFNIARGRDERPVESARERKSIGSETTFEKDLDDIPLMLDVLAQQAHSVSGHLQQQQLCASTLSIKVKYADFTQVTRSYSVAQGFESAEEMIACLPWLLARTEAAGRPVRLLGISLSGLKPVSDFRQLQLDLDSGGGD
ncbi:MAG: DNA polymerase IV [Gammaproteobacteria bacterium]|nr:DNA polymerase IV [Gammaproteobacteria bacterium]